MVFPLFKVPNTGQYVYSKTCWKRGWLMWDTSVDQILSNVVHAKHAQGVFLIEHLT